MSTVLIFGDSITGGFLWGNILAALIALGALLFILGGIYRWRTANIGGEGGLVSAIGGLAVLVATAVVWLWASWPLSYDYHHWIDKTVTVREVNKRLVASDKSMYQKFVVRGADGELLGIDDTRAALIKTGDTVRLRCKRAYQFGVPRSSHGWDCRWVGSE